MHPHLKFNQIFISCFNSFVSCADGVECVDSGWLTCQTEIRLRLHYSVKPPVSITKNKFKNSRFR